MGFEENKDPSCNESDSPKDWVSRVNKHNSQAICTGKRLYENMASNSVAHEKKDLGVVPKKTADKKWSVDDINKKSFPVQAHHLIPKNFLPGKPVCVWLAIKFNDNNEYKLIYDSCYDADGEDNGYCMPYANLTKEWKKSQSSEEKTVVAFQVMDNVGVQLHQGSHAKLLDKNRIKKMSEKDIMPEIIEISGSGDTDEYEEASIHAPGYLNKTGILLDVVHAKTLAHVSGCKICKKGTNGDGKTLVQPLESVTLMMHNVSKIIKMLIDSNVMFVSGYAYSYAHDRKYLTLQDGKICIERVRV